MTTSITIHVCVMMNVRVWLIVKMNLKSATSLLDTSYDSVAVWQPMVSLVERFI